MSILIGKKQTTPVYITKEETILDTDAIVKWSNDNKFIVGSLALSLFVGIGYFIKESKYAK